MNKLIAEIKRLEKGRPFDADVVLGGIMPESVLAAFSKKFERIRARVLWTVLCELDETQRPLTTYGRDEEGSGEGRQWEFDSSSSLDGLF